jgi:hypothetical protein
MSMLLSGVERELLDRLATREQISVSDYLRGLIKREAGKHFGWTPDTAAKRGSKR